MESMRGTSTWGMSAKQVSTSQNHFQLAFGVTKYGHKQGELMLLS